MRRNALIGIFLVFALGGYLAYRIGMPVSPDAALVTALTSLRDADDISGVLNVVRTGDTPYTVRGVFSVHMPAGAPHRAVASFASVEEGDTPGMNGEVRSLGDTTYVRLGGVLPGAAGESVLTGLTGPWLALDAAAVQTLIFALGGAVDSGTPREPGFAPEAWRSVKMKAFDGSLFASDGAVVREEVDGRAAFRYDLVLTRAGGMEFARHLHQAIAGRTLSVAEARAAEEAMGARAVRVTAWVDARTGHMTQLAVDMQRTSDLDRMTTVLLEAITTEPISDVPVPEGAVPFAKP